MKVKLELPGANELIKRLGVDPSGEVQTFHTNNVLQRITKYMPYRSGVTIKLTIAQTDTNKPEIVTDTPYARVLYYGVAMEGKAPKRATDRPLNYTKNENPQAGPFWDRALVANEGAALVADLQAFIDRRKR